MELIDAFSKEDRVEITVSQLYTLLKEAGRADLFRNGVKNRVPYEHILQVMDGNADALIGGPPMKMSKDACILFIKAKLLQAEIEMNGMIAENKQREIEGQSMAYTEREFMNLIKDYELDKLDEIIKEAAE